MQWIPISDEIRLFILKSIPSIPYLEAMLLLHGDVERQWEIGQIAKRLFINDKDAAAILMQLLNAGIAVVVSQEPLVYQYHPQSDELKNTIDRLAEVYSANLIEVTNLIHSNTSKKAQKFADAFLWKKDL
jgi:hypothetical protein